MARLSTASERTATVPTATVPTATVPTGQPPRNRHEQRERFVPRVAAFFSLLLVLTATNGYAQYPDSSDVATPEALVTAAYEAIMRAPGQSYNWDRFRSLFLPSANLIPNTEQSGGEFVVMSPEDFITRVESGTVVGGPNDRGFAEEAVHNIVEQYGDIAHVFSHYQKHFWEDDRILGRGINTFQLVRNDGRWWIVGIVWDEVTGAGPIPPRYWGQ